MRITIVLVMLFVPYSRADMLLDVMSRDWSKYQIEEEDEEEETVAANDSWELGQPDNIVDTEIIYDKECSCD